jgi:hypothetical protein
MATIVRPKVLGAATLVALILLAAPSTSGHYEPSYLTYRTDSCGSREVSDPINVVLFSANLIVKDESGAPGGVVGHVYAHTRWQTGHGSRQWVRTHGACVGQEHQNSLGFKDKHHMREFPGGAIGNAHRTDAGNRVWTGDAHRERFTNDGDCGTRRFAPDGSHVVYKRINGRSGFDQGAAEIVGGMTRPAPDSTGTSSNGHSSTSGPHQRSRVTKGPHYRTFRQCNGDVVGWQGRVHHIAVNPH